MTIKEFYQRHKSKIPTAVSLIVTGFSTIGMIVITGRMQSQIDELEFQGEIKDMQVDFLQDQIEDLEQDIILARSGH